MERRSLKIFKRAPKVRMNVDLPFDSSLIKYVFRAMQQFDETGRFPLVSANQLVSMLDCLLFLGFDKFLIHLVPLIAQNLSLLSEDTLRRIPMFLRPLIVNSIPISLLDPDFIVKHFGDELLQKRVESHSVPKMNIIPFKFLSRITDDDPNHELANQLVEYDVRFVNFDFVGENCTSIHLKKTLASINNCSILQELIITSAPIGDSISEFLLPTLIKLEITRTKLNSEHFIEIVGFLPNSKLKSLSLRETKMGSLNCEYFTELFSKNPTMQLEYIDISSNGIGAGAIEKFLESIANLNLKGVAIDANFFQPSSYPLRHFKTLKTRAVSLRGIHWDGLSCEEIGRSMKNTDITWWDLSAQVVHQHSDPDLSANMAEMMLKDTNEKMEAIFFSNHQLTHIQLGCIAQLHLKALALANSGIGDDSIEALIPLIPHLYFLDLTENSITCRNSQFLTACATSPNLKCLILSNNDIGDGSGAKLFDDMLKYQSKISTLRLRSCFLRKHSSEALYRLLGGGFASFDELDIGGNEMFHTALNPNGILGKSRVDSFFLGGNQCKAPVVNMLLSTIKDLHFIDLDRLLPSIVKNVMPFIPNVAGLSLCFSRINSDSELIAILTQAQVKELWIIHSISQKSFEGVISRYLEIPTVMAIHIGTDLTKIENSPIPIIVENEL